MSKYFILRIDANGHINKIYCENHIPEYGFLKEHEPNEWTFGFDIVYCPSGMVLLVDDCGLMREDPVLNSTASFLAKSHIVGDVLLFDHAENGELYAFDHDFID